MNESIATIEDNHLTLNLDNDTLSHICHFLQFKDVLSFEKCNSFYVVFARIPHSVVSLMNPQELLQNFFLQSIAADAKEKININRFINIEKLNLSLDKRDIKNIFASKKLFEIIHQFKNITLHVKYLVIGNF